MTSAVPEFLDHDVLWTSILLLRIGSILFALAGVLFNTTIVCLFVRYAALRASGGLILLYGLAITDLIVVSGSIVQSTALIITMLGFPINSGLCAMCSVLCFIGHSASNLYIACIAYDRVRAVKTPIKFFVRDHMKVARRLFVFCVGHGFVFSAAMTAFNTMDFSRETEYCQIGHFVPVPGKVYYSFALVVCSVIMIVCCFKFQKIKIDPEGSSSLEIDLMQQKLRQQVKTNVVIVRTIMMYVMLVLLPMLGIMLAKILQASAGTMELLYNMNNLTQTLNSTLNLFIYVNHSADFATHLRRFFNWKQPVTQTNVINVLPKNQQKIF